LSLINIILQLFGYVEMLLEGDDDLYNWKAAGIHIISYSAANMKLDFVFIR